MRHLDASNPEADVAEEAVDLLPAPPSSPNAPVIVNPATGQVIALDAATNVLAEALEESKAFTARLRAEHDQPIKDELLRRMDRAGAYTYRGGGLKVTGDGPRGVSYDGEILHGRLSSLVKADVIDAGARDQAVETVIDYKVHAAKVKLLAKHPEERVREAVKAAEIPNEKPRSVRTAPDA